jgi:hypothetical protein
MLHSTLGYIFLLPYTVYPANDFVHSTHSQNIGYSLGNGMHHYELIIRQDADF